MKYKHFVLFFGLFLLFSSSTCQKENIHKEILFKNNSETKIRIIWDDSYPDTNLFCPVSCVIVSNGSYGIEGSKYGWEDVFKSMKVLQIFVVSDSVAKAEPCDSIRKYHKILRRYQFTYDDLVKLNWVVSYP